MGTLLVAQAAAAHAAARSRIRLPACRGLCDCFRGQWSLPYQQIPWALPFAISRAEALDAFARWMSSGCAHTSHSVTAVRPCWVPYYVFEGTLEVAYTGVAVYDDPADGGSGGGSGGSSSSAAEHAPGREVRLPGLRCPPVSMGASMGPTMAVYAGFGFRRVFVREAISGDLADGMLAAAVPLSQLQTATAGHGVEAFKMKPSFAYVSHVLERLEGLAHHDAQAHFGALGLDGLGGSMRDEEGGAAAAGAALASRRVEDIACELSEARLHTKGVVMLPLYAIEYSFLGQRFRAFVSAMRPTPTPSVAGLQHAADARWAADDGKVWRAIGEMRTRESQKNASWKVRGREASDCCRVPLAAKVWKGSERAGGCTASGSQRWR